MSSILYKPQSINTSADPGLQHVAQKELEVFFNNTDNAGDTRSSVIFEQINNVVTNVIQANPADTVLDLVDLNAGEDLHIGTEITATVLTGDPMGVDRTILMAAPELTTGRRIIVINRSQQQNIIVKDSSLNTIVVVEGQTSEEILSDGYNWIAVN